MSSIQPIDLKQLEKDFPGPWTEDNLRISIAQQVRDSKRCIVVLDDDPTGTQTVYNTTVLITWGVEEIRQCLEEYEPILYILTNTRSMSEEDAVRINREIVKNLLLANAKTQRPLTIVSRSDSTLRGHFPAEVNAIEHVFIEGGEKPFCGICIVPFFPEGGRYTAKDIHWVQAEGRLVPSAQTPYALDPVFGYKNSYLPLWVEEKTRGKVSASDVVSISLQMIREAGPDFVLAKLMQVEEGSIIVVNAIEYRDLEVFVKAIFDAEAMGKRFLFRTAASFVKVAGGLPDRSLLSRSELVRENISEGGLIVFGSYVPTSTLQLKALLDMDGIVGIELPVEQVIVESTRNQVIANIAQQVDEVISSGVDAVIYTSREIVKGNSDSENLAINRLVSSALMAVVGGVTRTPRFLIGKGGITSSDLVTSALKARSARIKGQIFPGVPVWDLGKESRWPGLPYIVFPGNVGKKETVAEIVNILRG